MVKDWAVAEARDSLDPEVPEKPRRRRLTAEYKLSIVTEADACTNSGEAGALLRREGLYSSHLSTWRRQRDEGQLAALSPKKRGRRARRNDPLAAELAQVRREKAAVDNPYSESQFKTLKYRPGFPDRFGSMEDAQGFCRSFFAW